MTHTKYYHSHTCTHLQKLIMKTKFTAVMSVKINQLKTMAFLLIVFLKNSLFETEFVIHQKPTNSFLMLSKEKHVV